ncbi:MAG: hypothetical protein J6Y08_11135 [Clostridiales bacterium]|nr:hypothetical protein [Clostridiales bacterium]
MSFLTAVKKHKNQKIWIIAAVAVVAVALIVTAVILIRNSSLFYKKKDTGAIVFKMTEAMSDTLKEGEFQKGYMFTRTEKNLMEDRGTSPWLLSWYVLPGTTRSVPALESSYVDTYNQVLLLDSYILEGKKSKADKLIKAIDSQLTRDDGYLAEFARISDLVPDRGDVTIFDGCDRNEEPTYLLMEDAPASLAATSLYLRVLMDYYDKWGDAALLTRIEEMAEFVFATDTMTGYKAADQLAKPTPIPVSEDMPITPEPDPEEDPGKEKLISLDGLELSSMDLEALYRASVLFPEYEEKYQEWVKIVKEGKISETLPLYAWMYTGNGEYMYYAGSAGTVDLLPSLYTMVQLARLGELDNDSYAWVQQQMINSEFLYTAYDLLSGTPASSVEAVEAYPLVMELAIIKGDENLFRITHAAIMRQYATLSTSQALYMVFRNMEEGRYAVYARENLLLEIYLR